MSLRLKYEIGPLGRSGQDAVLIKEIGRGVLLKVQSCLIGFQGPQNRLSWGALLAYGYSYLVQRILTHKGLLIIFR